MNDKLKAAVEQLKRNSCTWRECVEPLHVAIKTVLDALVEADSNLAQAEARADFFDKHARRCEIRANVAESQGYTRGIKDALKLLEGVNRIPDVGLIFSVLIDSIRALLPKEDLSNLHLLAVPKQNHPESIKKMDPDLFARAEALLKDDGGSKE